MRTRTKFAILLLAVLLTFVGFSMMASSSVGDMIRLGNEARLHIISNHLAM